MMCSLDNKKLNHLGYNSFVELIEEFQQKVYSTSYSFVLNPHDAEDLAQEIFLSIYKNLELFDEHSKLSTWIYRISVNKCMSYCRNKKRRSNIASFINLKDSTASDIPDSLDIEKNTIIKNEKRTVHYAVWSLPQKYSTVLTLKYYEDKSINEIAKLLETAPRTIETRLYRAKKLLKSELENIGFKRGDIDGF